MLDRFCANIRSGSEMSRAAIVGLLLFIGISEALTVTDLATGFLPGPIYGVVVVTAFFAVIALGSFTGNVLMGGFSFMCLWKLWGWPAWRAFLVSPPFWLGTYRLMPKPW